MSGNFIYTSLGGGDGNFRYPSKYELITPPTNPPVSIDVIPDSISLLLGEQINLVATVTYQDGATDNNVAWVSSNQDIASVDANGLVNALGNGTANIFAYAPEYQNINAYCRVNSGDVTLPPFRIVDWNSNPVVNWIGDYEVAMNDYPTTAKIYELIPVEWSTGLPDFRFFHGFTSAGAKGSLLPNNAPDAFGADAYITELYGQYSSRATNIVGSVYIVNSDLPIGSSVICKFYLPHAQPFTGTFLNIGGTHYHLSLGEEDALNLYFYLTPHLNQPVELIIDVIEVITP